MKARALFLLFILGGGLIRVFSLANFSLSGDEAISALLAGRIARGFGPSFPSGLFEVRGELYWYLLGLWTKLTGNNEMGLRLLSSLFGIAGIGALYALGKAMYSKEVGLLASSFYAFSPVLVGLSRIGRMYSMWIFFIIIMFFLLYRGKIWLGILCFLASYFIHRGTLIFIPGAVLFICLRNEAILKKICYLAMLGLVLFLVMMHLVQNPRLNIEAPGMDASNEAFIKPGLKGASFYTMVLLGLKRDYIKKELGEIEKERRYFDIGKLLMLALFLAGLMRFKREDALLYGTFLAGLFIVSFLVTWKWERYLAGFYPFLFIGSAKGTDLLRKSSLIAKCRLGIVFVVIVFFIALNPLANSMVFEKKFNWAPDFKNAYKYIEEESKAGDIVIASEPATALFYLNALDYFSQEEDHMIFLYKDRDGKIRERYGGREVLDSAEKWAEVLEKNKRVWFITDILKFPYKFSEETVGLIYNKFNLAGNFYLVKIFQYEKGEKGGYVAGPKKEDFVPLEAKFYYYSGDIIIRNGNTARGVECFQISRQINPWYLIAIGSKFG